MLLQSKNKLNFTFGDEGFSDKKKLLHLIKTRIVSKLMQQMFLILLKIRQAVC